MFACVKSMGFDPCKQRGQLQVMKSSTPLKGAPLHHLIFFLNHKIHMILCVLKQNSLWVCVWLSFHELWTHWNQLTFPWLVNFIQSSVQLRQRASPARPHNTPVYLLTQTCWHAWRHTCMHAYADTHTFLFTNEHQLYCTQHLLRQMLEVTPTNHKHGWELTIRSTKYTTNPCTMLQCYHHTLQNHVHTHTVWTAWQEHPTTRPTW